MTTTIRNYLTARHVALQHEIDRLTDERTKAVAALIEIEMALDNAPTNDRPATTNPGELIIRELEAAGRELTVHELAHRAGLTQQQVSDALRPLVSCGDVEKVSRGVYKRTVQR